MLDQPAKVREFAWNEICPWLLIVRCLRIALFVRVFVLGAIGLVAVTAGWRAVTSFFADTNDPVIQSWRETGCQWAWHSSSPFTISVDESPDKAADLLETATSGILEAPFALWIHITRPFIDLFDTDLTGAGFCCLLLCGIWEILVWAFVGGIITRIAALSLTRGESPELRQAAGFSWRSLFSYAFAPLIPLGFAGVLVALLAVVGLAMRSDVVGVIAAVLWPLVLTLGLLLALLLLGLLVGWPFMWATISVEGTDAFDALSRAYAYTYQRPLKLVWYVLFAGVIGALGLFIVKVFALATIGLSDWSINWGLDQQTMRTVVVQNAEASEPPLVGLQNISRGVVLFWKSMLAAAAAGYQAGFLWTAAVAIYLLLRLNIDAAEMDEVFVEDEEPDFGMPPLEEDITGVHEVAVGEPALEGDA